MLSGYNRLEIVHGIGTGRLKDAIKRYIRQQYKHKVSMQDAAQNAGGVGVTVLTLNS